MRFSNYVSIGSESSSSNYSSVNKVTFEGETNQSENNLQYTSILDDENKNWRKQKQKQQNYFFYVWKKKIFLKIKISKKKNDKK